MNNRIYGEYLPGSLRTKFNFSEREIDESFKCNEDYYYVASTSIHEIIHHLQFIGTTTGRYMSDMLTRIGLSGFNSIKKNVESNRFNKLRRPLINSFLLDTEFAEQLSLGERLINNELRVYFLLSGIMNNDDANNELKGNLDYLGFDIDTDVMVPSFIYNNANYTLGLNNILESFASINERIFIYSSVKDKEKQNQAFKDIPFDPYYIIESYIGEEDPRLSNYLLICVIIDIALNPTTSIKNGNRKWTDFHPGWRLKRIVEFLKRSKIDFSKLNNPNSFIELKRQILENFSWKDPWEDMELIDKGATNLYLNKIAKFRKDIPQLFFHPVYYNEKIFIEFSEDPQKYATNTEFKEELLNFDSPSQSPNTNLYAYSIIAAVCEQFLNLYLGEKIICPYHGLKFPENSTCVEGCMFELWFETLIGFSLEEYGKIPKI